MSGPDIYEVPEAAKQLVASGIITINVIFTETGIDVWARSARPHPKLGVFPNESYSVEEIVDLLRKVQVSPRSTASSSRSPAKAGKGKGVASGSKLSTSAIMAQMENMTVADATKRARKNSLNEVTKNGVRNIVPATSLIAKDFELSSPDLLARCILVGSRLGNDKIMARISTSVDLRIKGVKNLFEWWNAASDLQRTKVLSDRAKLNLDRLGDRIESIGLVPCPFRGNQGDMEICFPNDSDSPTEEYETDEEH